MLVCPVCGEPLLWKEKSVTCPAGHSFDIAREGYVNLLRSSKSGDRIGDDRESARSRRDFLNKGYYALLRAWLTEHFADRQGSVLDICCGEGYYTSALGENPTCRYMALTFPGKWFGWQPSGGMQSSLLPIWQIYLWHPSPLIMRCICLRRSRKKNFAGF